MWWNRILKFGNINWSIAETEDDLIKGLNEWKDNVENRGMKVTHTHTHNRFTAGLEYVRLHPGQQVPER